jgi:hypothetical protein
MRRPETETWMRETGIIQRRPFRVSLKCWVVSQSVLRAQGSYIVRSGRESRDRSLVVVRKRSSRGRQQNVESRRGGTAGIEYLPNQSRLPERAMVKGKTWAILQRQRITRDCTGGPVGGRVPPVEIWIGAHLWLCAGTRDGTRRGMRNVTRVRFFSSSESRQRDFVSTFAKLKFWELCLPSILRAQRVDSC